MLFFDMKVQEKLDRIFQQPSVRRVSMDSNEYLLSYSQSYDSPINTETLLLLLFAVSLF